MDDKDKLIAKLQHDIEMMQIEMKIYRSVQQNLVKLMEGKAEGAEKINLNAALSRGLETYHQEAVGEGRLLERGVLVGFVEQLDACLVCRVIDSDTHVLDGLAHLINVKKQELGLE